MQEWQVARVVAASNALGIPTEEFARHPALLGMASARSVIPSLDDAPQMRVDGRRRLRSLSA
ncbi:hypothetical protein GCM10010464_27310 [Pseudonocardia yunnanensis]|uniref:hypothetical protein n=1 Tax=Pseudonocardia yunnanensis TaxID=58107 RepID=UPI0031E23B72